MRTLLVGYRAADLTPELLEGDVTCHVLDIYHRHAIEKVHHVKAVCSPHLPEGPWDVVKFKTGPKIHSGELALDLLQECCRVSGFRFQVSGSEDRVAGCRVEVEFEGRERDRNDLLNKIKNDPKRVRSFKAEWPASVPGGDKLMFTSYPGCFCHRRQDEGGLALAEVVSKDLSSSIQHSSLNPRRLLDMGCGCGLVGLLIARAVKGVSLVGVDSHSRAIEAANLNAQALGVEAEMILSDNGTPARMDGTFDVFVGNPPYYSDYRIAEVFLDTAKRALKPGGVCYTVCKNAAGLEPVQRQYFPDVEIIKRRGYAVLKSVKPL